MSARPRPEPVQVVKQRRDAALRALAGAVPYIQFLGIEFDTTRNTQGGTGHREEGKHSLKFHLHPQTV